MSKNKDNSQNPTTTTGIHSLKLIPLIIQLLILTVRSDDDDCHQQYHTTTTPRVGSDSTIQMLRGGSPFKIALFADLHFGEATSTDWGPQQDVKSIKVMSTVLDLEQPEMVIYLGDVITANNLLIENATLYWDEAISPTRNRGIPWASVFGNHDDAPFVWPIDWFSPSGIPHWYCPAEMSGECSFKGTSRLELMQTEIKNNRLLSYSKNGPKELWPGVSNYVLQVSSSTKDTQVPVAYLYFLDSGGGSYPEVISSGQAQWFNHTSQKLNPDSKVPEIIFWHIPSKAYKKVAPKKYNLNKKCVGSLFSEKVAPQQAEMGIMKLLVSRSSVKAVFVGHNHGLDWCCPYKKLYLCYARHTGYGGYGNWDRGARILEIIEKPFALKSWIRMEDGHVHSEIHLVP